MLSVSVDNLSQLAGTELNTHSLESHQLLAIQLDCAFANSYPVFYLKQRITMAYIVIAQDPCSVVNMVAVWTFKCKKSHNLFVKKSLINDYQTFNICLVFRHIQSFEDKRSHKLHKLI